MARQQKIKDVAADKGAERQASVQEIEREAVQKMVPHYPAWPTSKPGPQSTPPPPGMRPINAIRREQVAEVGYNQETGEPSTHSPLRSQPDARITEHPAFDQAETAQEALHRRKHRLEE